jgi:hypothetical protein
MFFRALIVIVLLGSAFPALGQDEANKPNTNWPGYREGDYVIHDYKFASGASLPEMKLHYRTIGTAKQNAAGEVVNAVLLLQGNTGTAPTGFGRRWLTNCSSRVSRSTRQSITSSSPTHWAVAAHRNHLTASRVASRITSITTWLT